VATLAPVALFVFNRLDGARQVVDALRKNDLAAETDVIIFSDGGTDERSWREVRSMRAWLHTIRGFRSVRVVERATNYYIERNLAEGVAEVLAQHESIIVLEDDVVPCPTFLRFMNDALREYRAAPKVMHIAGWNYLPLERLGEAVLWRYMECTGGWATWRDRWAHFRRYRSRAEALAGLTPGDLRALELGGSFHCLDNLDHDPIPWDVCWYISIYRQRGLCLTPTRSQTVSIGLYGGTHFRFSRLRGRSAYETRAENFVFTNFPQTLEENAEAIAMISDFYKQPLMRLNLFGKAVQQMARLWRAVRT